MYHTLMGMEFHIRGAATAKALSHILVLASGMMLMMLLGSQRPGGLVDHQDLDKSSHFSWGNFQQRWNMYEVVVLKEGYSIATDTGHMKACGTITLLKGQHTIIVDTGNPWDRNLIVEGLRSNGLSPENVDYCICTHGHSDHVGNLNLFNNAVHIVSYDICQRDQYIMHDFKQGIPFEIDEHVEVVPTPGHTGADVSVLVKTSLGVVAVTGDLFERFDDLENPDLWQDNSDHPEEQEQSRIAVLRLADHIVPGHGPMFPVPSEYKKQLRVVMVYAEHVIIGLDTSRDYHVSEEGMEDEEDGED